MIGFLRDKTMSRLRLLVTSVSGIACVTLPLLAGAAGNLFRLTFPAAQLQSSATKFRDELETNYLSGGRPIPVFSLFSRAGISTVKVDDEKIIGKTSSGNARVFAFSGDGKTLTSDGNALKGVGFPYQLNGKSSILSVDIPAHLEATINKTPSPRGDHQLSFSFSTPLPFHIDPQNFIIKPPADLYLSQISISATAIVYKFRTNLNDNSNVNYEIDLDLTRAN